MFNKKMIDAKISTIINRPHSNKFDPEHNWIDWYAINKWCTNHEVKCPSFGREIWDAIRSECQTLDEAMTYWNHCWCPNGEDDDGRIFAYMFCFPSIWDMDKTNTFTPAPTEQNFLSYVWE